jgi:hypothetical protein
MSIDQLGIKIDVRLCGVRLGGERARARALLLHFLVLRLGLLQDGNVRDRLLPVGEEIPLRSFRFGGGCPRVRGRVFRSDRRSDLQSCCGCYTLRASK